MKRIYPFPTMQVGEVVTITARMKDKYFQHYVLQRARILGRRFTTVRLSDGVYEVRRIDGLPDEDKLAKSRSRSATLMWERRRSKA